MYQTVVILVVGMLGALLALTVVFALRTWSKSSVVPPHLQAVAIEVRYASQLARLRELTREIEKAERQSTDELLSDQRLFSLPEILEAKVQTAPHGWRLIGGKSIEFKRGEGICTSEPSLESAVVNTMRYELHDGSTISVAEYSNVLQDNLGVSRRLVLSLDVVKVPKPHMEN